MNVFNTSTDRILSVFTKTITKLESHIETMKVDEDTFATMEKIASEKKAAAVVERAKAEKAVKKLRTLFE